MGITICKLRHFLAVGLLAATSTTVYSQSIKLPTYSVGDVWTHRTTDGWTGKVKQETSQTVIGLSGEFIRVNNAIKTLNAQSGQLSAPILNDSSQRANFNVSYTANGKVSTRVNFDWPLEVGKKWAYEYSIQNASAVSSLFPAVIFNYKTNAEVVSFEEVDTPAGKFKAMKVVHRSSWKESANNEGTQIFTSWYAPQVKRQVKSTFESFSLDGLPGTKETTELLSYIAPM